MPAAVMEQKSAVCVKRVLRLELDRRLQSAYLRVAFRLADARVTGETAWRRRGVGLR